MFSANNFRQWESFGAEKRTRPRTLQFSWRIGWKRDGGLKKKAAVASLGGVSRRRHREGDHSCIRLGNRRDYCVVIPSFSSSLPE